MNIGTDCERRPWMDYLPVIVIVIVMIACPLLTVRFDSDDSPPDGDHVTNEHHYDSRRGV